MRKTISFPFHVYYPLYLNFSLYSNLIQKINNINDFWVDLR